MTCVYLQLQAINAAKSFQITQLTTWLAQAQAQAHRASKTQEAQATAHQRDITALQCTQQQALSDLLAAHQSQLAQAKEAHRQELSNMAAAYALEVAGLAGKLQQQQQELHQLKVTVIQQQTLHAVSYRVTVSHLRPSLLSLCPTACAPVAHSASTCLILPVCTLPCVLTHRTRD